MSGPASLPDPRSSRVLAVDALRGLTIAVMVLVNDAEEATNAPWLLKHMPPGRQGITIADVVVPAFTLVVGLSVPLALGAARARGDSLLAISRSVLWRAFGLLTMGVFMMNRHGNTSFDTNVWTGLMYLGFIAAWCAVPKMPGRKRAILLGVKILGVATLIVLALSFRGKNGERLVLGPLFDSSQTSWLLHGWWDILGQLGFAYVVACLLYLVVGNRRIPLLVAIAGLVMLYPLSERTAIFHADGPSYGAVLDFVLVPLRALHAHVDLGHTLGIPGAMAVVGFVLGTFVVEKRSSTRFSIGLGTALAVAAVAFEPYFGVTKHASTPTWALASCAVTVFVWIALERAGERLDPWLRPVQPAAQNALLVYFIHPLVRGAMTVFPGLGMLELYKAPIASPLVATLGCMGMVALVVWLTVKATRLGVIVRV